MNYIFGYGSIINDTSRLQTINSTSQTPISTSIIPHGQAGSFEGDQAVAAYLSSEFGQRSWCFRSSTGFTALGLTLNTPFDNKNNNSSSNNICGVLFPVLCALSLAAFDQREVGYTRVRIPSSLITINTSIGSISARNRASTLNSLLLEQQQQNETTNDNIYLWVYIPNNQYRAMPDEEFPILQTYVDVCVRGCLQWGGEAYAIEFLRNTSGWSDFYLNDAPMSRRPWLHRMDYISIDKCLQELTEHVRFVSRKHPEEFAARHLTALRVEIVGFGGVGKTQITTEYVHRYFGSNCYGLIAWLRAESPASITADLRRLAYDLGILKRYNSNVEDDSVIEADLDDEAVVEEVRRRLARCQCRWLLVFDNVEDPNIIQTYVPRGISTSSSSSNQCTGHVLATSRIAHNSWINCNSTLVLDCFDRVESLQFLQICLGEDETDNDISIENNNNNNSNNSYQDLTRRSDEKYAKDLTTLADRLGHLPLALSMAAAYMNRCSVSPEEYLQRTYSLSQKTTPGDSILSALSVTLTRIQRESNAAANVLSCLGFVSSDNISKNIIQLLLVTAHFKTDGPQSFTNITQRSFLDHRHGPYKPMLHLLVTAWPALLPATNNSSVLSLSKAFGYDEELLAAETDQVWDLLRQFSLLSVRGPRNHRIGSIHRLQQSVLRSRSSAEEVLCIERCIWVFSKMWSFEPTNSASWDLCADLLDHIEIISKHSLIITTSAMSSQPSSSTTDNSSISSDSSSTLISNARSHASSTSLRWYYALKLAHILTDAGSFCALVLSRFDTAQSLLDMAATIHLKMTRNVASGVYGSFISEVESQAFAIDKATTLHNLGKILRYNGRLEESGEALTAALTMRKKIMPVSHGVADTMHELGVLFLKRHALLKAEDYLSKSLSLKRQLKRDFLINSTRNNNNNSNNCSNSNPTNAAVNMTNVSSTGEAATLHQLAVVATANRQYNEAESLLYEALELELALGEGKHEAGSRLTSRAATLQQLGRVAMRRGKLDVAESRFRESLALYERAYGPRRAACNVNVAAVRHQLGATAAAAHRYDEACMHFSIALKAREAICNDHFRQSVVFELQALAKAEMDRGHYEAAEGLFIRERGLVESLLVSFQGHSHHSHSHGHGTSGNVTGQSSATINTTGYHEHSNNLLTPSSSNNSNNNIWLQENIINEKRIRSDSHEFENNSFHGEDDKDIQPDKDRRIQTLEKALIFTITCLKQIAKQNGQLDKVSIFIKELYDLRHRVKIDENNANNTNTNNNVNNNVNTTENIKLNTNSTNTNNNSLEDVNSSFQKSLKIICDVRNSVRMFCKDIFLQSLNNKNSNVISTSNSDETHKTSTLTSSSECIHPIIPKDFIEQITQELNKMHYQLNAILSAEKDSNIRISIHEMKSCSRRFTEKVTAILSNLSGINIIPTEDSLNELFAACDDLRSNLRALGAKVE
eukprot:gene5305-10615_t